MIRLETDGPAFTPRLMFRRNTETGYEQYRAQINLDRVWMIEQRPDGTTLFIMGSGFRYECLEAVEVTSTAVSIEESPSAEQMIEQQGRMFLPEHGEVLPFGQKDKIPGEF